MARRRQGRLLAALALASGLCLAVTGCIHNFPCGNHWTSREAATPSGPSVMTAVPASDVGQESPRDLFSALGFGGHHVLHKPRVIQPGEEIAWSIETPEAGPGLVHNGRTMVGPEGTVVVGPYGSCNLGGLTPQQAGVVLKRQVTPYVKNPQVTVRVQETTQTAAEKAVPVVTMPERAGEAAWRAPRAGAVGDTIVAQPPLPAFPPRVGEGEVVENRVTSFRPVTRPNQASDGAKEEIKVTGETAPAPATRPATARWPWSLFRTPQKN